MEINFDKVLSIAKAMDTVYQNRNNLGGMLDALVGNEPSLASILTELENDIVQGLTDVVNAIENQTLTAEWGKISNTLGHVFTTLSAYKQDLTTVQLATSGPYNNQYIVMTENGTKQVLFSDWCLGYIDKHSGLAHRSILDELGDFIGPKAMQCGYSSLVGIFSHVAPDDPSGSQGYDAINTWTQILTLGKQNPPSSTLGMRYIIETQYESMLRLMDCTHTLVSMTLYVHDTALQLLVNITQSNQNRYSVLPAIVQYFGDCSTSGTVWHKFSQALQALPNGAPGAQLGTTSYTTFSLPANTYQHLFVGSYTQPAGRYNPPNTYIYNWHYCSNQVSLAESYPNSFFASLGFVQAAPSNGGDVGYRTFLGLQGTVVTIGPGLTYTNAGLYPSQASYADMSNWNLEDGIYVFNEQFSGVNTFEPSFVNPPAPASNNQVIVITGFQQTVVTNGSGAFNVGIALQFGALDVSDPDNPVVTVLYPNGPTESSFIPQAYTKAMAITEYYSINQVAGYTQKGDMKLSVLTNAAHCRAVGWDDAPLVQVAPTFYMADFFQPAKMQQIVQSKYETATAG